MIFASFFEKIIKIHRRRSSESNMQPAASAANVISALRKDISLDSRVLTLSPAKKSLQIKIMVSLLEKKLICKYIIEISFVVYLKR